MTSNFLHLPATSHGIFHERFTKAKGFRWLATIALRIWLVALVAAFTNTHPLPAQTNFNWLGPSGNWNVAANWSPLGVPGPADTATIGASTVTLNVDATVATLN